MDVIRALPYSRPSDTVTNWAVSPRNAEDIFFFLPDAINLVTATTANCPPLDVNASPTTHHEHRRHTPHLHTSLNGDAPQPEPQALVKQVCDAISRERSVCTSPPLHTWPSAWNAPAPTLCQGKQEGAVTHSNLAQLNVRATPTGMVGIPSERGILTLDA